MRRAALLLLFLLLPPPAFAANGDIASGLTEALVVGAKRVVAGSPPGGFLDNPKFRIPLPGPLEQARSTLKMVGPRASSTTSTSASTVRPSRPRRWRATC